MGLTAAPPTSPSSTATEFEIEIEIDMRSMSEEKRPSLYEVFGSGRSPPSPQTCSPSILAPSASTPPKGEQRPTRDLLNSNLPSTQQQDNSNPPIRSHQNEDGKFTWNQDRGRTYFEATDEDLRKEIVVCQPPDLAPGTSTWSLVQISFILRSLRDQQRMGALSSIASEVQEKRSTEILRLSSLRHRINRTFQDVCDYTSLLLEEVLMDSTNSELLIAVSSSGHPALKWPPAFHIFGRLLDATLPSDTGTTTLTIGYRWHGQSRAGLVHFGAGRFSEINLQGIFLLQPIEFSNGEHSELIRLGMVRDVPPEMEMQRAVSRVKMDACLSL